jgi:hypothetical protein
MADSRPTTKEEAEAAVQRYGSQRKAAKAFHMAPETLAAIRRGDGPAGDTAKKAQRKAAGVSVAVFIGRYDYDALLRKAIADLCSEAFVTDSDIRLASGIPAAHFRRVAEQDEFCDCQIRDQGKVWWSTKHNVARVRAKQQQWGIGR